MIPSSAVSPANLYNTITLGFNFKNINGQQKQMPKALKLASSYYQMKPNQKLDNKQPNEYIQCSMH